MRDDKEESIEVQSSLPMTSFLGWGEQGRPADDDPAEAFHEASKNTPSMSIAPSVGIRLLETNPRARATILRPVKEHPHLPSVSLPAPEYPDTALRTAIAERRSRRQFGPGPITLQDLSTLLHAGYGVTHEADTPEGPQLFRSVPSGGALHTLEIYPVVRNVEDLAPGLYHYHPFRHALEVMHKEEDIDTSLGELVFSPPDQADIAQSCSVVFFMVGIFWRTRFKYGLRGVRWVLVEAGHIGQNMLLSAESLGLSAFPNGGFWERRVDAFVGVDGVNESVVYCLVAGTPPES